MFYQIRSIVDGVTNLRGIDVTGEDMNKYSQLIEDRCKTLFPTDTIPLENECQIQTQHN